MIHRLYLVILYDADDTIFVTNPKGRIAAHAEWCREGWDEEREEEFGPLPEGDVDVIRFYHDSTQSECEYAVLELTQREIIEMATTEEVIF